MIKLKTIDNKIIGSKKNARRNHQRSRSNHRPVQLSAFIPELSDEFASAVKKIGSEGYSSEFIKTNRILSEASKKTIKKLNESIKD